MTALMTFEKAVQVFLDILWSVLPVLYSSETTARRCGQISPAGSPRLMTRKSQKFNYHQRETQLDRVHPSPGVEPGTRRVCAGVNRLRQQIIMFLV